ncbi:MAG: DUF4238 domain-containing protein [Clostridia bacterium]|nr:DUF4238 domain-containing protein [Clostridia bacterium]
MFAHIIPRVYQKSWHSANGPKNVYYFDNNCLDHPISSNGNNIDKKFGENDFYNITAQDNENGLCANELELEEYFSNTIENKFGMILQSNIFECLESKSQISGNLQVISAEELKETPFEQDLLDFIILQQLRIYDNFNAIDNGNIETLLECIYNFLLQKKAISITYEELLVELQNSNFKKSIWKSILLDCKDKDYSFLALARNELLKNCNLTFLYIKDEIKTRFILSDNPIIWNSGKNKKYQELESGIFFPIKPNCLVAYLNYGRDDIKRGDAICLFPKMQFIKYINCILLQQSKKQIGFMNKDVKNHFSQEFDKIMDWDAMFK